MNHVLKCQVRVLYISRFSVIITTHMVSLVTLKDT